MPEHGGVFQGIFLADHSLPTRSELVWQKMTRSPLNGTTRPVNIEEEGRGPTMDRQTDSGWRKDEPHAEFSLFSSNPL